MTPGARLETIFRDVLDNLHPAQRVASCLREQRLGDGPLTVLAMGKAAPAMAAGALDALGGRVTRGLVVAPGPCDLPTPMVTLMSSHPEPGEGSVAAAEAMLALAGHPAERIIALISGGASALVALPAPGLSLADKVAATRAVYRSGAPIEELNIVRKHLSAIKGGRLGEAARAPVLTLVSSDVVGDRLDAVGSGPTIPDASTFADAVRIVTNRCGWNHIPASVRAYLESGALGRHEDTPARVRAGDVSLLVGGIGTLVTEAARVAQAAGIPAHVCDPPFTEDVESVADRIYQRARGDDGTGARCLVFGGEATIRVAADPGSGGRAQHLALLLAERFRGATGITALVCGSDGIDGNTAAAGAIVDSHTWRTATEAWGDPRAALARCDAGSALAAASATVMTGPTGINHADLVLVHVDAGW